MAAYVLVDMDVTDPERYEEYKPLAEASILAAGGRYLARGGSTEVLEGSASPHRTVILEFPAAEAAREWYHGLSYRHARAVRDGAATGTFVLVDGV